MSNNVCSTNRRHVVVSTVMRVEPAGKVVNAFRGKPRNQVRGRIRSAMLLVIAAGNFRPDTPDKPPHADDNHGRSNAGSQLCIDRPAGGVNGLQPVLDQTDQVVTDRSDLQPFHCLLQS